MSFEGFPSNVRQTPIPDPLFNHLLEEIQDLGELKVTLRAIWLLGQKRGAFRSLTEEELTRDPTLLRGVRPLARYSPEPVPGLAPASCYLLNTTTPAGSGIPMDYGAGPDCSRSASLQSSPGSQPGPGTSDGSGTHPGTSR